MDPMETVRALRTSQAMPFSDPEGLTWVWWKPVAEAPVPPREVLMHNHWRCLLQDKKGFVVAGYAAYIKSRAKESTPERLHRKRPPAYVLQWYAGSNAENHLNRVFKPVYWMPLPQPREVT